MASSRHEHVAELFPGVSIAISSELAELNLPAGVRRIQQHTLLPSGAPQLAVSPNRQKMAARKCCDKARETPRLFCEAQAKLFPSCRELSL